MPKHRALSTDFVDIVKFHLDDPFIQARGCKPEERMMFADRIQKAIAHTQALRIHKTQSEFWADFYYLVRDVCGFQSDDDLATAFHLNDTQRPFIDDERRAAVAQKQEEAQRLKDEAEREQREIFQRENRIREILELLPRLREQFDYLENVMPGEFRSIIEDCNVDAGGKGYSLSPHSQINYRPDYITRIEARAHAAAIALEKHPARLEEARKQITDLEAELERLEPNKRTKKRKAA
jgi:hypothetical protein